MTFRKQIVVLASGLALAAALGLIPRQAGSQPGIDAAPAGQPAFVTPCPSDALQDV
ncbi:hypothetical protein [Citreimonas salinaria]|uniref:Uncharacterized protein n=1 Tax=Citreimonas salinaria TaxID=321339 RepID=A0A1H3JN92_9RHOB|nr:hypothetical protein [Citreimonas salinaria]SDY41005.1 hypothetical protein SAMN05444340_107127 [Citreimonas salinaria]